MVSHPCEVWRAIFNINFASCLLKKYKLMHSLKKEKNFLYWMFVHQLNITTPISLGQ